MTEFKKVLLVLLDGMRPDSLAACGSPVVEEFLAHSVYTLAGTTVMPSVTLPCHMSLFHSVTPQRHGILTNTYVPQVRPIKGLFEVLLEAGKSSAMCYNWEELRDLGRPSSLTYAIYANGHGSLLGYEKSNDIIVDGLLKFLDANEQPDFTFLYLGWPDSAGHTFGWMSPEYLNSIRGSLALVQKVMAKVCDDTLVVLAADHGGHDRSHGTELPEDMTIPVFLYNRAFAPRELAAANIIDLAPTIVAALGGSPDREWEGKSLL